MNEELVKCTGLCRSFEAVQALRGVDLSLTSGKIVGLLGPNGSGKTTLIKILNGLLQPTAGEARIAGLLPGVETKAITSYLPDRGYFPDWMRVRDMIDMFSDFYADFDRAKAEEMCRVLGLEAGRRIKTLSKGTREKMQLMLVMSRRARLYLLDEPIAGVDPAAREFILRTILTNYNENGIKFQTHCSPIWNRVSVPVATIRGWSQKRISPTVWRSRRKMWRKGRLWRSGIVNMMFAASSSIRNPY